MLLDGRLAGLFSILGWITALLGGVGLIVYEVIKRNFDKRVLKAEEIEKIRESDEYKRSCLEVDEQNRQRQAELDKELYEKYTKEYEEYQRIHREYQADCEEYEAVVQYHKDIEVPEWSQGLAILETSLTETKNALKEIYSQNIIPLPYRNRSALMWLATYIGTSQYDLQEAINRYDTFVMTLQQREQIDVAKAQLMLAKEQMESQQYANWIQEQQLELAQQGNEILNNIDSWQKAYDSMSEFRGHEEKRAMGYKERKAAKYGEESVPKGEVYEHEEKVIDVEVEVEETKDENTDSDV
jgi:hypothetical protein